MPDPIEEDLTQMADDEEATSSTWLLSIEMIPSVHSQSAGGTYHNNNNNREPLESSWRWSMSRAHVFFFYFRLDSIAAQVWIIARWHGSRANTLRLFVQHFT